jgi:hypothetical protein
MIFFEKKDPKFLRPHKNYLRVSVCEYCTRFSCVEQPCIVIASKDKDQEERILRV